MSRIKKNHVKIETLSIIISLVLSLFALVVSIYSAVQTYKHNRHSVRPLLMFDNNFSSDSTYGLIIKNVGLGPAIIKSFDVFLDNKKVEVKKGEYVWDKVCEKLKIDWVTTYAFDKDDTLENANMKHIFIINDKRITSGRRQTMQNYLDRRINVHIAYVSLYDEFYSTKSK